MTDTIKKTKPKLEFFSKRVGILSLLIGGGTWYWFSYRPQAKKQKNLDREAFAREYWKLHQSELVDLKKTN